MRTNKRASAVIIKDNQVLLIHRFRVERGEYFVFPGGGVESEESVEQALVREMKEELGITVLEHMELFDFWYERIYGSGKKHDHYFLVNKYVGDPQWIEGNEGLKENQDNRYSVEWHEMDKVPNLQLLPEEMKERIAEIKNHI